tara:strand:+ start:7121 stop:8632 length:1512 start_codon:yes stop_codon:yes gene_type:complete
MNYKDNHIIKFGIFKPLSVYSNGEIHTGLDLFYDHPEAPQFSKSTGEVDYRLKEFEVEHKIKFPISDKKYNELFGDDTRLWTKLPDYHFHHPVLPPRGVEKRDYKEYIKKGERFILNVLIDDWRFFEEDNKPNKIRSLKDFHIPEDMLNALHSNKCTLLFDQIREGHYHHSTCVEFMQSFAEKFKLNATNLMLFSGNSNAEALSYTYASSKGIKLLFTPVNTYHFEDTFWFTKNSDKYHSNQRNAHYTYFNNMLQYKLEKEPEKHFLCLNRRLDVHRMAMFSEFKINKTLKDKGLISLGNCYDVSDNEIQYWIKNVFDTTHNYEDRKVFFEQYDFSKNYVLDKEDFYENFATSLPTDLHKRTFAPVVTETLKGNNEIFFSEKTYRPIYCAQPFFILGNRGQIGRLRELGYKTFGKWWDESYDEQPTWQTRFTALSKTLEEVAHLTPSDLHTIQKEMEETLIHNFNLLMSKTRYRRVMGILSDCTRPTETRIIPSKTRIIKKLI